MTLTIEPRFRGPSSSGNGGYVAGLLAAHVQSPTVTVTLRQPPPLDVALDVLPGDGDVVRLTRGTQTVAEAVAGDPSSLVAVPAVAAEEALRTSETYPGLYKHPFPECFVCGPSRAAGDGMRLFPGRLDGGRTACVWVVGPDLAAEPQFVWAALDCPGGWTAPIEGRPMVLGRMTAQVSAVPAAGETCVVMGRLLGSEGRKTWTVTTAYDPSGAELGRAHATWIMVNP